MKTGAGPRASLGQTHHLGTGDLGRSRIDGGKPGGHGDLTGPQSGEADETGPGGAGERTTVHVQIAGSQALEGLHPGVPHPEGGVDDVVVPQVVAAWEPEVEPDLGVDVHQDGAAPGRPPDDVDTGRRRSSSVDEGAVLRAAEDEGRSAHPAEANGGVTLSIEKAARGREGRPPLPCDRSTRQPDGRRGVTP